MNRVWEIRESHDKHGDERYEGYRGKMSSRRGRMSGYKDKDSFDMGFEEGYCEALDHLDAFLDEHSKK